MIVNSRSIRHLGFALSLTIIPILFYSIVMYLGGNRGNPLHLGIFAVILSLNIIYSFYILKSTLLKKLAFALTTNLICYFLAVLLTVGINVENEIWGIWIWLIVNAFFTILSWEIIYQLTRNSLSIGKNTI